MFRMPCLHRRRMHRMSADIRRANGLQGLDLEIFWVPKTNHSTLNIFANICYYYYPAIRSSFCKRLCCTYSTCATLWTRIASCMSTSILFSMHSPPRAAEEPMQGRRRDRKRPRSKVPWIHINQNHWSLDWHLCSRFDRYYSAVDTVAVDVGERGRFYVQSSRKQVGFYWVIMYSPRRVYNRYCNAYY